MISISRDFDAIRRVYARFKTLRKVELKRSGNTADGSFQELADDVIISVGDVRSTLFGADDVKMDVLQETPGTPPTRLDMSDSDQCEIKISTAIKGEPALGSEAYVQVFGGFLDSQRKAKKRGHVLENEFFGYEKDFERIDAARYGVNENRLYGSDNSGTLTDTWALEEIPSAFLVIDTSYGNNGFSTNTPEGKHTIELKVYNPENADPNLEADWAFYARFDEGEWVFLSDLSSGTATYLLPAGDFSCQIKITADKSALIYNDSGTYRLIDPNDTENAFATDMKELTLTDEFGLKLVSTVFVIARNYEVRTIKDVVTAMFSDWGTTAEITGFQALESQSDPAGIFSFIGKATFTNTDFTAMVCVDDTPNAWKFVVAAENKIYLLGYDGVEISLTLKSTLFATDDVVTRLFLDSNGNVYALHTDHYSYYPTGGAYDQRQVKKIIKIVDPLDLWTVTEYSVTVDFCSGGRCYDGSFALTENGGQTFLYYIQHVSPYAASDWSLRKFQITGTVADTNIATLKHPDNSSYGLGVQLSAVFYEALKRYYVSAVDGYNIDYVIAWVDEDDVSGGNLTWTLEEVISSAGNDTHTENAALDLVVLSNYLFWADRKDGNIGKLNLTTNTPGNVEIFRDVIPNGFTQNVEAISTPKIGEVYCYIFAWERDPLGVARHAGIFKLEYGSVITEVSQNYYDETFPIMLCEMGTDQLFGYSDIFFACWDYFTPSLINLDFQGKTAREILDFIAKTYGYFWLIDPLKNGYFQSLQATPSDFVVLAYDEWLELEYEVEWSLSVLGVEIYSNGVTGKAGSLTDANETFSLKDDQIPPEIVQALADYHFLFWGAKPEARKIQAVYFPEMLCGDLMLLKMADGSMWYGRIMERVLKSPSMQNCEYTLVEMMHGSLQIFPDPEFDDVFYCTKVTSGGFWYVFGANIAQTTGADNWCRITGTNSGYYAFMVFDHILVGATITITCDVYGEIGNPKYIEVGNTSSTTAYHYSSIPTNVWTAKTISFTATDTHLSIRFLFAAGNVGNAIRLDSLNIKVEW